MTGPPPGVAVPDNRWDLLDQEWPANPPLVTVVVTHFEQPTALARTLHALERQTHPRSRLETVVVDDGSRRRPVVPEGVRLLRQADEGFRAGTARNLGANGSGSEVLVFLDADTTPEPDYVHRITRLPSLAPDALVVGRREHADLTGVPVTAPIELAGPRHRLDPPAWLAEAYAASGDLLRSDHRSYRFVIAAVLACHRSLWDRVGGFDETITGYGGEDWDWAARAWDHGALLAHESRAVAWHDGPDWAGRLAAGTGREQKNRETLTLATRHSIPGLRPRSLRLGPADVEVRLSSVASRAVTVLVLDSVLSALPGARVRVPEDAAWAGGYDDRVTVEDGTEPRARIQVEQRGDVRVHPDDLAEAVRLLDERGAGTLVCLDRAGERLAVLRTLRGLRRARAWGRADLTRTGTTVVRGDKVADEPDLEAHLGGWA